MAAIVNFVFAVVSTLLTLVVWVIIANAFVSWLIAFDVVNLRNRVVRNIVTFLYALTRPFMRPFRRVIPPLGGIDITPVIVIIIISAAQQYLLPALQNWLLTVVP